jgi:hypothetical protein
VLLVIGGYIDGSNLHGKVDVIAVAGCAAVCEEWKRWEQKWGDLLKFSGLDRWDHAKFMARWKPAKPSNRWREPEWLIARRLLCEAFDTLSPVYVGASVTSHDYLSLRSQYVSLPSDPYYFLIDRCMNRLIQGLFERPKDEGVAIYCDQDKEESLVLQISKWHEAYVRNNELISDPLRSRRVVTSYGSNVDYVPLQAVDVVAHELMRFVRRNPGVDFVPTNVSSGSEILDKLIGCGMPLFECLSREALEPELDGSAWVPGIPHGFRFGPSS